MKPGAWPDLPKMLQTVKDAGYKPVENGVQLQVTGTVVKQGDALALELGGMTAPVTLPLVPAKEDPNPAAQLAEKYVGQALQVTGRWIPPADGKGPGSLAPTSVAAEGKETK